MQNSKQPQRRTETASQNKQTQAKSTTNKTRKIRERRRMSTERRHSDRVTQFPIITTQGICVRKERRKIPERRMSNIVVKETVMNEEVFETLFSNYLAYKKRVELMKKLNN